MIKVVTLVITGRAYHDSNGVTYWHCNCILPGDASLVCIPVDLWPDAHVGDKFHMLLECKDGGLVWGPHE